MKNTTVTGSIKKKSQRFGCANPNTAKKCIDVSNWVPFNVSTHNYRVEKFKESEVTLANIQVVSLGIACLVTIQFICEPACVTLRIVVFSLQQEMWRLLHP